MTCCYGFCQPEAEAPALKARQRIPHRHGPVSIQNGTVSPFPGETVPLFNRSILRAVNFTARFSDLCCTGAYSAGTFPPGEGGTAQP